MGVLVVVVCWGFSVLCVAVVHVFWFGVCGFLWCLVVLFGGEVVFLCVSFVYWLGVCCFGVVVFWFGVWCVVKVGGSWG